MFWPITGTAGGDLGLLVNEIIPEIQEANARRNDVSGSALTSVETCESLDFCNNPAEFHCDDGHVYCEEHLPEGVACWRFS